jgi:hypothetical protein
MNKPTLFYAYFNFLKNPYLPLASTDGMPTYYTYFLVHLLWQVEPAYERWARASSTKGDISLGFLYCILVLKHLLASFLKRPEAGFLTFEYLLEVHCNFFGLSVIKE